MDPVCAPSLCWERRRTELLPRSPPCRVCRAKPPPAGQGGLLEVRHENLWYEEAGDKPRREARERFLPAAGPAAACKSPREGIRLLPGHGWGVWRPCWWLPPAGTSSWPPGLAEGHGGRCFGAGVCVLAPLRVPGEAGDQLLLRCSKAWRCCAQINPKYARLGWGRCGVVSFVCTFGPNQTCGVSGMWHPSLPKPSGGERDGDGDRDGDVSPRTALGRGQSRGRLGCHRRPQHPSGRGWMWSCRALRGGVLVALHVCVPPPPRLEPGQCREHLRVCLPRLLSLARGGSGVGCSSRGPASSSAELRS